MFDEIICWASVFGIVVCLGAIMFGMASLFLVFCMALFAGVLVSAFYWHVIR